ncbi:MAG: hypothetical protein K2Q18_05750, partial [Bdellovibrionales bacterium]|nr:hypothetical protein [Bdellovibrionales bacterium]
ARFDASEALDKKISGNADKICENFLKKDKRGQAQLIYEKVLKDSYLLNDSMRRTYKELNIGKTIPNFPLKDKYYADVSIEVQKFVDSLLKDQVAYGYFENVLLSSTDK